MKIKIIVCCHKRDIIVDIAPYIPIQLGKSLSEVDLGILGDNTGDNISYKNHSYCELTGLYWMWKNMTDVDVAGIVHYRRFFDFHKQIKFQTDTKFFSRDEFQKLDLSIPNEVCKMVRNGAIVLAKPHVYGCSLYDSFCQQHNSWDLKLLQRIIQETQPKKYYDAFTHVMYLTNKLSPYNMFMMNRDNLNKYCAWLFPLLVDIEHRVDINSYGPYYGRLFGFLAERLLNVWCYAENKKILYYPVMMISDVPNHQKNSVFKKIGSFFLKYAIISLTRIKYRHMYGFK